VLNLEELEKLFEEDYRVVKLYPLVNRKLKDTMGFISFFKIKLSPRDILHPSNSDKTIAVLRKPTGHQVEVFTSDEAILNRINKRLEYQKEPIGVAIRARCLALGGRSTYERIFHLDQLVESLNGLWGWEFKLGEDVGTFDVFINIEQTDRNYDELISERLKEELQHLLYCLTIIHNIGFYIQHFSWAFKPRIGIYALAGQQEAMIGPVTPDEISNINTILKSDKKKFAAAQGLSQSYIENCMPSRLSMLWAATEQVFHSEPQRLLTKDEINQILESAKNVESLENDPDRLDKLKNAISDPSRVSLKSRNKIMAENIAHIMKISEESAYSNLRVISKLRGKNVHQLSDDWEALREAEKFLQEALLSYLKRLK